MNLKHGDKMRIKIRLSVVLACIILAGCNRPAPKADNTAASDSDAVVGQTANPVANGDKSINPGKPDETRLVGEWLRTDGGYRLRIL